MNDTEVIGYRRVSTDRQVQHGHGMHAQTTAIQAYADQRQWQVKWIEDPGRSGKLMHRPGIKQSIPLLETGAASGLIVARLDRLGRNAAGLHRLLQHSRDYGWALIALDMGLDATTPMGQMMFGILAEFAQWEASLISARTKEALAAARQKDPTLRLGRQSGASEHLLAVIRSMRAHNATFAAIAEHLNNTDTPTLQNGKVWRPAAVHSVLSAAGDIQPARRRKQGEPLQRKRKVAA
jgi:DNA invertase Pin-like site-specific DNA recombinase